MKHKHIYKIILFSIILSGCSSAQKNMNNTTSIQNRANINNGSLNITDGRTNNYRRTPAQSPASDFNNRNSSETPKPTEEATQKQEIVNETIEERAKKLATSVEEMSSIQDASVVITGNTAIVGINLTEEMSDGKIIELKQEIVKRVKALDKDIDHVTVTASPELFERIMNMSGAGKGKIQQEHNQLKENEENELLFRLTPTI